METRQYYHVTVPLSEDKPTHVYFKEQEVFRVIPPRMKDSISVVLQSISHQLAEKIGPKSCYVSQLQKDTSKGDAGGLLVRFVSEDNPTPTDIYLTYNQLFGMGTAYSKSEIPFEPLPSKLASIASSMHKEAIELKKSQERTIAIEVLKDRREKEASKKFEQERKQAEEKARLKETLQKEMDAEKAKEKAKQDLAAVKRQAGYVDAIAVVTQAAEQYQQVDVDRVLAKQDDKKTEYRRKMLGTGECDSTKLKDRIKTKQAVHSKKLEKLKVDAQEMKSAHKERIDKIQQDAEAKLVRAYQEQYDQAMASLYHRALEKSLAQYTTKFKTKDYKTASYDLNEIALAVGVPVVQGNPMTKELAYELYCQRVIDHFAKKSYVEMIDTITNIRIRLGNTHPFIAALDRAVRAATTDQHGHAHIAGFSAGALQKEMQASADMIKEMQADITKELEAREEAIKQYEQFLEKEKADLVAVESTRQKISELEMELSNKNRALAAIKEDALKQKMQLMQDLADEKITHDADRAETVNKAKREIDQAIRAIDNLQKSNKETVTQLRQKLSDPFISASDAQECFKETQDKLEASINAAQIHQQVVVCAGQGIKACQVEMQLVQKGEAVKALQAEADRLLQEMKAIDPSVEEKTPAFDEVYAGLSTIKVQIFTSIDKTDEASKKSDMESSAIQGMVEATQILLDASIPEAEAQVKKAEGILEAVRLKHAEMQYEAAQKKLYDQVNRLLSDQISFWGDQCFQGGGKVLASDKNKLITVPTGIADMIHLIKGKPEKNPYSGQVRKGFFSRRSSQPDSYTLSGEMPADTPKQIGEILIKFQTIANKRLGKNKGFFKRATTRTAETSEIYKALKDISVVEGDVEKRSAADLLKKAKELDAISSKLDQSKAAKHLADTEASQAKKQV